MTPEFSEYIVVIRPQTVRGKTRRLPPSLNARMHWRERADWTIAFKAAAVSEAGRLGIPRMSKVRIEVRDIATRFTDFDNLASAMKPILDGLVLARVMPDDNPETLVELTCRAIRAPSMKTQRLELIIRTV